ncbi:MAG: MucR family transcriptional regulator [Alphaproteobacteria bacterium]|nr:MucR family transcriptional regulator [Alphaproteobacteria bacterium]
MAEQNEPKTPQSDVLRMTAQVVASYLSNNMLPATQIPEVISTVYTALNGLGIGGAGGKGEPLKPAVPVRKSITPEFIICLEDGKKLKMLKRHLRTTYDLTPDEYRAKWGLPPEYPMVAPNYAAQRSAFAKKIGLGRTAGKPRGRGRGRG